MDVGKILMHAQMMFSQNANGLKVRHETFFFFLTLSNTVPELGCSTMSK